MNININVQNFTVTIKGKVFTDRHINLAPGVYTLLFKADGYNDYTTNVTIDPSATITVNLVPAAKPAPSMFTLTVQCNVPNAIVFLNNNQVGNAGNPIVVPPGMYQIRVSAPGYADFNSNVTVQSSLTLPVSLVASTFTLAVTVNVNNAQIQVNNMNVNAGSVVSLPPGNYNIHVSAPGYSDYNKAITLNGNQTVNVVLTPNLFSLQVNVNVSGAIVFVNNNQIGNSGAVTVLAPGTYPIRVTMPGYQDYNGQVQLAGNQIVNVQLQAAMGMLQIVTPRNAPMVVQVDNDSVNIERMKGVVAVMAGQHTIRITYGSLVSETTIMINPGQTMVITPKLSLDIK